MSAYFMKVGRVFEVSTHPEQDITFTGLKQNHHMFPQGTLVVCTRVYPVGHHLNATRRLKGLFEGQVEVAPGNWQIIDQELSVTDVKVFKETNE